MSKIGTPTTKHSLSISGYVWSESKSDFNRWPIIACIDDEEPTSNSEKQEEDFEIIGHTEEEEGWIAYSYSIDRFLLSGDENSSVYFAFGISVTWESVRTYYLDFLIIRIDGEIYQGTVPQETNVNDSTILPVIVQLTVIALITRKKRNNH